MFVCTKETSVVTGPIPGFPPVLLPNACLKDRTIISYEQCRDAVRDGIQHGQFTRVFTSLNASAAISPPCFKPKHSWLVILEHTKVTIEERIVYWGNGYIQDGGTFMKCDKVLCQSKTRTYLLSSAKIAWSPGPLLGIMGMVLLGIQYAVSVLYGLFLIPRDQWMRWQTCLILFPIIFVYKVVQVPQN